MDNRFLSRGKRVDNGEWIEGGFCIIPHPPVCIKEDLKNVEADKPCIVCENPHTFADWGMPRQMCMVEVDSATVSQCTSLEDKNGKLIFEGDLVRYSNSHETLEGVVEWLNCQWVIRLNSGVCKLFDKITIEIIGTIHDTPGELGGEKGEAE